MSNVAILTLNWNNWNDSKNLIESILDLDHREFDVVFIDNASQDGSVGKLISYLDKKKIQYELASSINAKPNSRFIIIQNSKNLGYTGGFNKGLQFVLKYNKYEFAWLLNNDVVLKKDALSQLLICFEEYCKKDGKIGVIGSTILYPDGSLQMLGGCTLYPIFANSVFRKKSNQSLDYISGASLFIPVKALKEVGFFDERYFLYWDDADLGIRMKRKNFKLVYCPKSFIYHKEGGTSGKINTINDYYWVRNGLLFTKKHYPYFLPIAFFAYFFKFLVLRTINNQPNNVKSLIMGTKDFLLCRFGPKP